MRTPIEVQVDNLEKTQILLRELRDAAERWSIARGKRDAQRKD